MLEREELGRKLIAYWRALYLLPEITSYQSLMEQMRAWTAKPYVETKNAPDPATLANQSGKLGIVTAMLTQSLSQVANRFVVLDTRLGLAKMLAAAARYQAHHGVYPADAAVLKAEYPDLEITDLFDGQPFRIIAKNGGIVIYSIGLDGRDDQGVLGPFGPEQGDMAVGLGAKPIKMTPPQPDDTELDTNDP